MKTFLKEHGLVVGAIAIPLIFILGIFLTTYIPSLSVKTSYNFIYAICDTTSPYENPRISGDYDEVISCREYITKYFHVENGAIVFPPESVKDTAPRARLFLHDTGKNHSVEITENDARALVVKDLLSSPDGVTFTTGSGRTAEFFVFSTGYDESYYLTKGDARRRLNIVEYTPSRYYNGNMRFIGWIVDEQ